jgi:hypothetical protein
MARGESRIVPRLLIESAGGGISRPLPAHPMIHIEWHLILEDGMQFEAAREMKNRFGRTAPAGTRLTWHHDIRAFGSRTRPSVWFRDEDVAEDDLNAVSPKQVLTEPKNPRLQAADAEGNGLLF